jgi:hypothetical protein
MKRLLGYGQWLRDTGVGMCEKGRNAICLSKLKEHICLRRSQGQDSINICCAPDPLNSSTWTIDSTVEVARNTIPREKSDPSRRHCTVNPSR